MLISSINTIFYSYVVRRSGTPARADVVDIILPDGVLTKDVAELRLANDSARHLVVGG